MQHKTIPLILQQQFKPDVFCIGSYLTQAENVEERSSQLNHLVGTLGQDGS